jgi:hypothetical protein
MTCGGAVGRVVHREQGDDELEVDRRKEGEVVVMTRGSLTWSNVV